MQLKGSKCIECGKTILSKSGKAKLCMDKSTCRVAHARKQKKAQKEAEKMTVTLEQHALWELICKKCPQAGSMCNQMLIQHGKEAFGMILVTCAYMLKVEDWEYVK